MRSCAPSRLNHSISDLSNRPAPMSYSGQSAIDQAQRTADWTGRYTTVTGTVTAHDADGAKVRGRYVAREDMSFASWLIATQTKRGTPVTLKIRTAGL